MVFGGMGSNENRVVGVRDHAKQHNEVFLTRIVNMCNESERVF